MMLNVHVSVLMNEAVKLGKDEVGLALGEVIEKILEAASIEEKTLDTPPVPEEL